MSISNEVLLDRVETGAPKTAWGVKAMSNTIRCLMINLTHWQVTPVSVSVDPSQPSIGVWSELSRLVVLPVTGPI